MFFRRYPGLIAFREKRIDFALQRTVQFVWKPNVSEPVHAVAELNLNIDVPVSVVITAG